MRRAGLAPLDVALGLARGLALGLTGGVGARTARAQAADAWRDHAPHRAGTVGVAPGVRLHYLDWGGRGTPIVFLAGLGNTAHAWDEFAGAFTGRHRVVALTRRGFGESSHPADGYDVPTLAADLLAALDSLHLDRVVLVGHSFAGEEMTRLAAEHPARVAKLVYLEAAYDRPTVDSAFRAVFPTEPPDLPTPPAPAAADTATPAAYVAFVQRTRGVAIPEADIRTRMAHDGWNESAAAPFRALVAASERPPYARVRAPALAVYAVADSVAQLEPWYRADAARAPAVQAYLDRAAQVDARARAEFRRRVRRGRVLVIHGGHHWIFVSHRNTVLRAMRAFLEEP
jgi:non-heme chloroperoxidase